MLAGCPSKYDFAQEMHYADETCPNGSLANWDLDFAGIASGIQPLISKGGPSANCHPLEEATQDPCTSKPCKGKEINQSQPTPSEESDQQANHRESHTDDPTSSILIDDDVTLDDKSSRHHSGDMKNSIDQSAVQARNLTQKASIRTTALHESQQESPHCPTQEQGAAKNTAQGGKAPLWEQPFNELQTEICAIKKEMESMRSHFTSVLTLVQSQIQQILQHQEGRMIATSTRINHTDTGASSNPTIPLTTPYISGSDLKPLCEELSISQPRMHNLAKTLPNKKWIRAEPVQTLESKTFPVSRRIDQGDLPSYAKMRRSEIESTQRVSTINPLEPIIHHYVREGRQLPGIAQEIQKQDSVDVSMKENVNPDCGHKTQHNIPLPWARSSIVLPVPAHPPPKYRSFQHDLQSSLSLSAHMSKPSR